MPSTTEIIVSQLARLIGTPHVLRLLDVRTEEDFAADPRLIPGAIRRDPRTAASWKEGGDAAVVYCQHGGKLSQGAAAWMRHAGTPAQTLVGGFAAWRDAGEMLVQTAALPALDPAGRTVWVTRARPKVDRIACPWLIRRFVDPYAVFLFVAPSEVTAVGARFGATPFDIEDVFFSHRGPLCTFDTMLAAFGLTSEPLRHLARIVRGADTAQFDLAPQAAGVLAASLGLSRMFRDDLQQLDAGMVLYDALYRWCRDATAETHNWPSVKASEARA